MANKNRVLFLLQILQEQSDEGHPLTTTDIKKAFQAEGCPATAQTIRSDIRTLRESGYEIISTVRNGVPTAYAFKGRTFEFPELQILVDAVSSSQFITQSKSEKLIQKLSSMSGPSHRGELQPGIFVSEQIKAPNSQIFNIVQKIKEGIREDRKISFKYYDYTLEKTLTPRHGGENYIISPYATVWKNDRYYLVGYSDKREKIVSFRIDRMDPPRNVKQPRIPAPSGFSIQDYSSKKLKMYDGPEERVTLSCKKEMVNHIIDCFGKDVELQNIRDNVFDVTVPVSVSKTFYSWLMQYAGAMVIKGPENVKQEYEDTLRSALTSVDGLK